MKAVKERAIITDKLVEAKTGKNIETWFNILDKKGAIKMSHVEIFNLISNTEALKILGEWNHNLLATSYEWSRKLKERGQKEKGFEISVSKTIAVPLRDLYNAWIDEKQRNKWLGKEKMVIRKATENKSARVTWSADETSLSIDFYIKAANKSQIVVQHQNIPDAKKAAEMKIFWGDKLDSLKTFLGK